MPSLCGCSTLPVKDRVIDSASPVYQAVIQPADKDTEMSEWARRAAQLQSKSFRVLAHVTGTEYSEYLALSQSFLSKSVEVNCLCTDPRWRIFFEM